MTPQQAELTVSYTIMIILETKFTISNKATHDSSSRTIWMFWLFEVNIVCGWLKHKATINYLNGKNKNLLQWTRPLLKLCWKDVVMEINIKMNTTFRFTAGMEYVNYVIVKQYHIYINTLSANPTKWSSRLKQFVGKSRRIVWVCLTILWGWRLKG